MSDCILNKKYIYIYIHWHRLVKNIGWANQNIGGAEVIKSDKCMGVSQLLEGTCPGCPPKSMLNAWAFLNYWGHMPGLPPKVYAYVYINPLCNQCSRDFLYWTVLILLCTYFLCFSRKFQCFCEHWRWDFPHYRSW